MRLVEFKSVTGDRVLVNPEHVALVRPGMVITVGEGPTIHTTHLVMPGLNDVIKVVATVDQVVAVLAPDPGGGKGKGR